MSFTIESNAANYGHLFQRFSADLTRIQRNVVEQNSAQLGSMVSEFIINKIAELHPIGDFMAERTEADIHASGTIVEVSLQGLTEDQVPHGKSQEPYNMWAMFEWGRPGGVVIYPKSGGGIDASGARRGGVLAFQKAGPGGGKTVFARYVTQGPITKYVGLVQSILEQISPDIEALLASTVAELVDEFSIYHFESAARQSGVKLTIPKQKLTMSSGFLTGGTQETLKRLGYSIAVNTSSGQINLRDTKGRFAKQTPHLKGVISTDPNYVTLKVSDS